ncbi:kappa-type opioid receptor-like [Watersipora subatra]|uniref:kappa-type opioid receptor-like n=1 Tax=Watersipora subatra TaxID=2589382 RepID=UPI00355BD6AA
MKLENNGSLQEEPIILETKPPEVLYTVLAVQILVLFIGVTLNTINIVILAKGKKFGRRIKIQLLNLAAADILTALLIPGASPTHSYSTLTHYPNSPVLCKIHKLLGYSSFYASLIFHGAIAAERFVATYFPFVMSRYKKVHVIIVVLIGWIISFGSTIGLLSMADVVRTDKGLVCLLNFYTEDRIKMNINTYFVKFLVPSLIILAAYSIIGVRLRKKNIIGTKKASKTRIKKREVLAMLAANGVFAVLIWAPYFIFLVVFYGSELTLVDSDTIAMALYGVVYTNCFITPLIYFAFNHDYRKDARKVLCARRVSSTDYEPTSSRDMSAPVDSISAGLHTKAKSVPHR